MNTILGRKQAQTQRFLTDGTRLPVTMIETKNNPVVMVKSQDKDGYWAVQLGYGKKNHPIKARLGHAKKGANLDHAPYFLAEERFACEEGMPKAGDNVTATDVLAVGDIVDVTGTSKGKGFAGVVKRHKFKGGPRTHGQSDRERAPGSIGQTTTPGRVYKNKRMAGKMGNDTVTIKNLVVLDVTADGVIIAGLVPGILGSYVKITKRGTAKHTPELVKTTVASDAMEKEVTEDATSNVAEPEVKEETKEEAKENNPINE